jgi:hypothetical protein
MKFQNTESVFSVIGDYPVVDQFDVLYSSLMSGSTYDNYITGTLLTRSSFNGTYYYVQGTRGLVFSKLGVNQNDLPGKDLTDENRSYGLQPWRERAGTIRNVKIFSNSERFYDSLTPSFSELIAAYGGEIKYSGGVRNTLTLELGNFAQGKNAGFLETFPFEQKFSKVKRVERLANSFIEYDQNSSQSRQSKNISITMLDTQSALNGVTTSGVEVISRQDVPYAGVIPFGPLEQDVAKLIFGYGDFNPRPGNELDSLAYTHYPYFRSGSYMPVRIMIGPVIRGWKYGLVNGNPCYNNCVFRRDRFGQFRDMLEQRTYPSIFIDPNNSPNNYLGSAETPAVQSADNYNDNLGLDESGNKVAPGAITFPVEVSFVKETILNNKLVYPPVSPESTWSSNLSIHATSSLPYFDGDSRNRASQPKFYSSLIDFNTISF